MVATVHESNGVYSVTLPEELARKLGVHEGSALEIELAEQKLTLQSTKRSKYTAEELLAQCDYSLPMSREDREWLDSPPVGRELI
jgi:antitoxin ChpS